jgi:beta-fructofuranosidase
MYSGSGYSDWEIGDVDVIVENGVYHLFHLIIPNHDYIAHAISKDGISWKRIKNALFVGDPGDWDDDMLWTMHTFKEGETFIMYYTGLQRRDRGEVQKIIHWTKVNDGGFPMTSHAPHYEDTENNPRNWLSFRDPFRFDQDKEKYLLFCGRQSAGPVSRRGCVGLLKWVKNKFELQEPIFCPLAYDDVECPTMVQLNGYHYLIGSIREDVKVRYWFSPEFINEYHSFHDNVLLPQGNYAARVVRDGAHTLIYNFYYVGNNVNTLRVLPPPKELSVDRKGRLLLKSFYRWNEKVIEEIYQNEFQPPKLLFSNPTASFTQYEGYWQMKCRSGHELFCISKPSPCFIWDGLLSLEGMGKCGLVTDCDEDGNGYFISFDFVYGLIQIRGWGFNEADNHNNFIFETLQTNNFNPPKDHIIRFRLIRFGNYIELSVDGVVKLTLMDYRYNGPFIGVYSSSSVLSLTNSKLCSLSEPEGEYAAQMAQVQKIQEGNV